MTETQSLLTRLLVLQLFSSLSDCFRLRSSSKSFIELNKITIKRGRSRFGIPPETDIEGIDCKIETKRK